MEPIFIGDNADGKPIHITADMRQSTHMHVIGGSGTGKSKFLEWMIRKDIREGNGLCLIDWHGTLYQDVLSYCAHLDVGLYNDFRSLILLNPSRPDYVTGFNPFMNQGDDIATQVANRIAATIRPWGITNTDQLPTFERVCRLLYTFAVEQKETLPNAAQLLQFDKPELREYAIRNISDSYIRDQWRQLQLMRNFRDWSQFVLSTENRFGRLLASKTIKRFFGLSENNINLRQIMDKQQILLINLGSSGFLDRESARVFASLLLNEFFETAMIRAHEAKKKGEKPKTFTLYLDEFQEYITDDIAAMLDQVRKGGLHMVLAHQHLGHLADNPRLLESILVNARIRAVFGGLSYKDACELANEMFLPDLNERQIKKAYYHTIHLYEEQTRSIRTHGSSRNTATSSNWQEASSRASSRSTNASTSHASTSASSAGSGFSAGTSTTIPGQPSIMMSDQTEGWFTESEGESRLSSTSQSESNSSTAGTSQSESESASYSEGGSTIEGYSESNSESVVPVWVPIPVQELGSEAEWSREEKVSKVAEMLKTQQQRHCFIKLDTEKTQPLRTPFVKDYSQSSEYLLEYEREVYSEQDALPAHEVDQLIADNEHKFLAAASEVVMDAEHSNISETHQEISKPTKKRTTGRKKKSANLFDTIKTEN